MMWSLALAALLTATDGGMDLPQEGSLWSAAAGVEVLAGVMSSQGEPNGLDVIASVRPILQLAHSEDFLLRLAPLIRLRVIDSDFFNRAQDFSRIVRGQDFDELSDLGSVIDRLQVGQPGESFFLEVGAVTRKTLGLGHLIQHYSARENVDYRPASATAAVTVNSFRAELFASDVLALRLFALQARFDVGRLFHADASDRFFGAFEAAHDAAQAPVVLGPNSAIGLSIDPVTLLQLDFAWVAFRSETLSLMALGGVGGRVGQGAGFLGGLSADVRLGELSISSKVEGRFLSGGAFRFGYFGPTYEVARFADVGFSGPQQAQQAFASTGTLAAELKFSWADAFFAQVSGEYFGFGRTDIDGTLQWTADRRLSFDARLVVVGLGFAPRFHVSVGAQCRLAPGFYLTGHGGTVMSPTTDGTLLRGVLATVGVGFDVSSAK
jgi:hypothetical protein